MNVLLTQFGEFRQSFHGAYENGGLSGVEDRDQSPHVAHDNIDSVALDQRQKHW